MTIVHFAGHLGADPDVRTTPSGQKVTSFRVAVNQRKGKEDVTVWWRVTVWGDQYSGMMPYLKKGSGVLVVGEMLPPEIFVDRDGNQRTSLECTAIHLSFSPFGRTDKREGDSAGYGGMVETGGPRQAAPAYGAPSNGSGRAPMPAAALSDQVPF